MPRKKMDGVRRHVILTRPQDKGLEQLSEKTGLCYSELLRRAVDAYLQPKEKN